MPSSSMQGKRDGSEERPDGFLSAGRLALATFATVLIFFLLAVLAVAVSVVGAAKVLFVGRDECGQSDHTSIHSED